MKLLIKHTSGPTSRSLYEIKLGVYKVKVESFDYDLGRYIPLKTVDFTWFYEALEFVHFKK